MRSQPSQQPGPLVLVWTPRALADLARLHRFLLTENPDAARRAVRHSRELEL
jgi:plasmid stabilization system protein ParE